MPFPPLAPENFHLMTLALHFEKYSEQLKPLNKAWWTFLKLIWATSTWNTSLSPFMRDPNAGQQTAAP